MIWKQEFNLEMLNQTGSGSMTGHLGIEFTGFGEDYLEARMPVDERTKQPMGLLHGGASCVLAETMGSVASVLCVEGPEEETVVGIEINANHLRPATSGYVKGRVRPVRVGRKLHVWNIEISNEEERLICVSRITIAIVQRKQAT